MRSFIASILAVASLHNLIVCLPVDAAESDGEVSFKRLIPESSKGFFIDFSYSAGRPDRAYLVSLGERDLKRENLEELLKLFKEPAFTTMKTEYAWSNGNVEKRILRYKPNESEFPTLEHFRYDLENFPSELDNQNLLRKSDALNNDILVRAICNVSSQHGVYLERRFNFDELNRANLSMSVGDFDSADKFINSFLRGNCSNQDWQNFQWQPLVLLVKNLVAVGKYSKALELCDYASKQIKERTPGHATETIQLAYSYSLVPGQLGREAFLKHLEIFPIKPTLAYGEMSNESWLADKLEDYGRRDQALKVLQIPAERALKSLKDADGGFCALGPSLAVVYRKARLEYLLGNDENALSTLSNLENIEKEKFDVKQRELLNRMPGFFPSLHDVQLAKAAVQKKSIIAKAPLTPIYPDFEVNTRYDVAGHELSVKLNFLQATECQSWLNLRNEGLATACANQMISAYEKAEPPILYAPVRQNLFNTILGLVRKFVDIGYVNAAKALLDKLEEVANTKEQSQISKLSIQCERQYIYARYQPGNASWDSNFRFTEKGPDLALSEKLRLLALAHYFADETARAKFFIDAALARYALVAIPGERPSIIKGSEQFALMLSAACIYDKAGDQSKAISLFKQAIVLPYIVDKHTSPLIFEAASVFGKVEKAALSMELLEKAIAKCDERYSTFSGIKSEAVFARVLSDLRSKNGDAEKSLQALEVATLKGNRIQDIALLAETYERNGNLVEASRLYREAAEKTPYDNQNAISMKYAQKAVYIYEKTPNHIDRLLAQMYILLAQRTLRTDREGAIKLYLKADSLLTEKDAEKTTNLSFLAYLSREKREIEQSKSAGKSKTPSAAEIALATKAAKIADSFDLVNAGRYFMTLANLNVEANNLCAAIKNCEHSIELYSRSDERYSTPFEISVPSDLLKALYVSGKSFIADGLVEKAIAKVKELHGGESMEYQAQLSSAFGSYSRLENFDAAEAKLNLLLSTKLDLGNWSPPLFGEYRCSWGVGKRELRSSQEVLELISNTLSELAKRKRAAFAIRCFDKLLGAEKAQFGPTDFRVGLTLSHLGRIYHGQGQNSEAEQYFLKALRIFCQNEELKFALTRVQPEYFLTLKKLGKAGTIDLKESELIKDKEAKLRSADKPRRQ